ncbi:hypothetical protein [Streptomyces sp. NPDC047046]|uniref:hypothetical protein n=1 Tax=Streptomyces sp. NPDC047046 TaxID=3155378 RepID=UPI0033FD626A
MTTATPMRPLAVRPVAVRGPFATELRRGPGPLTGAVTGLVLALMLGTTLFSWLGVWARTAQFTHLAAAQVGLPLALAAGCWSGGRDRAAGIEALRATMVRPRTRQIAVEALPVLLWTVAAYLLLLLLAYAATWATSLGGGVHGARLLLVPADAAGLCAATLAGEFLGRHVRWRLAAPGLGVLLYGLVGVLRGETPARVNPAVWVASDTPATWLPLLYGAGALALACALFLLLAHRRAAALPALLAALALLPALVHDGRLWHGERAPLAQVCARQGVPAVCVRSSLAGLLPDMERVARPMQERLRGVRGLPERYDDRGGTGGKGRPLPQAPGILAGQDFRPAGLTDPERYLRDLAYALLPCFEAETDGDFPTRQAVMSWLTGERDVFANTKEFRAADRELRAMTPAARADWLTSYFGAREACHAKQPGKVPAL